METTWPVRAFLQELGGGRLRAEERLLQQALVGRGVPISLYTSKGLQRGQLDLDRACYVSGDGDMIVRALRYLGIEPPLPLDYPAALLPFLRRPVCRSTLGQVLQDTSCSRGPVFAKPATKAKRFPGRVFEGHEDLYFLHGTSHREPVWCSAPVTWASEWRAYVLGDQMLALCHYAGLEDSKPERSVLRAMIEASRAGSAPCAFALDAGVLEDGATALVGLNDALALGAYGIAAAEYADLMPARWRELLNAGRPPVVT